MFDSCYAANMVSGRWEPNANIALVMWARKLLKEVEMTGQTVHWVHVKGHSKDGGNERADELVQWGKGDGPYCRLRDGGGEGESLQNAASTTPTGCVPVCDVLADGGEITRASGAARTGGAARRRRGNAA
eukprot:SAG11_NODE_13046_length_672_cov_1.797557_1_plen_129_part_01